MPTFPLRAAPVWVPPRSYVLRGALRIVQRTRNAAGLAFAQARIRTFASVGEALVARDVSDPSGVYGVSVPDGAAYFVVATQPGTFDSSLITWDSTSCTFDRTQSVGGVSAVNLRGSAG